MNLEQRSARSDHRHVPELAAGNPAPAAAQEASRLSLEVSTVETPDQSDLACPRCHGEGVIAFNPAWPDPQGEDYATCPECHGTGIKENK